MPATASYKQLMIACSNPFMIKGLNRFEVDGYQNLDHAAWGISTGIQNGGPVSSIGLSADYSQMISAYLAVGLKMHVSRHQWQGYESTINGGIKGKLLYRINDKTAWTSSIGIDKNEIKGAGSIRKSWSTEMGQTLNKELFIAIRLAKEDDQDLVLQMLLDWKLDAGIDLLGGINITSGNLMLGWLHNGKQNKKGLTINHHPLLGYGLEIFFCHGWN
jgi:hypothetical protein